jgi:hypothetical protein
MVQPGNGARLALEAVVERRQAFLDGDDATEARVARLVWTSPMPPAPIRSMIS